MSIHITCENCGKSIRTSEKYAGKEVKCPGCGSTLHIPSEKQDISFPEQTGGKKKSEKASGIGANCENCGKKINAPIQSAGKKVRCPSCRQSVSIPVSATERAFKASEKKQKPENPAAKGIMAECENCGTHIDAPEKYAGKRVRRKGNSGKKRKVILTAALVLTLILYFTANNPMKIQLVDDIWVKMALKAPVKKGRYMEAMLIAEKIMQNKLSDQRALAFVTINTFDRIMLYQAVRKLTDQKLMADVTMITSDPMMADRLSDPQSLKFVALNGSWLIAARTLKK